MGHLERYVVRSGKFSMVGVVDPFGLGDSDVDFCEKVSDLEAHKSPKVAPLGKVLARGCNHTPLISIQESTIRYISLSRCLIWNCQLPVRFPTWVLRGVSRSLQQRKKMLTHTDDFGLAISTPQIQFSKSMEILLPLHIKMASGQRRC